MCVVQWMSIPACLLRCAVILEEQEEAAEEPFPRGRKSAAPLTVRKLSLMLRTEKKTSSENGRPHLFKHAYS